MTFILFSTFYEKARKATFFVWFFLPSAFPSVNFFNAFSDLFYFCFSFLPYYGENWKFHPLGVCPPPSQFFCKQSPGWPIHLPGQLSRSAYLPPSSVEVCNTAVKLHNKTVHSLVGDAMTSFVFTVNDVTSLYTIAGGGRCFHDGAKIWLNLFAFSQLRF